MVAQMIRPGEHLHFASTSARPNALARAVADVWRGRGTFTVSSNAMHASMHALPIGGVVERAIVAFAGDTVPTSQSAVPYRHTPGGTPFLLEEWSLLTLSQRLKAAANGVAWVASRSLIGTDLLEPLQNRDLVREGDTHSTVMLSALAPDVCLLHAAAMTPGGDLVMAGPQGEGPWGALAARRGVVATVEPHVLREEPSSPSLSIPARRVLAWAPAPFGAHPQGMAALPAAGFPGYLDDYEHLAAVTQGMRDRAGALAWYSAWVEGVTHPRYLEILGPARLVNLTLPGNPSIRPRPAPHRSRSTHGRATAGLSDKERTILLASAVIRRLARANGFSTLLGGLGQSHIAAWHAVLAGRGEGLDLRLIDEMGNWGYSPRPGDTFLFSQRHVEKATEHLSTLDVLEDRLEQRDLSEQTLAVLSTAQVDQFGNLNSSRANDGAFLVGSGGASDIATRVRTLVVTQTTPGRLPRKMDFVTSPGKNVRDVVTERGWARHTDDKWVLSLAGKTLTPPPARPISQDDGWWPSGAPEDVWLPASRDIQLLRQIDPEGVYR